MFAALARITCGMAMLLAFVSSPAVAQADPPEGFAAHFHRDDTTILVIEDPLPHLRLLLNSQALRKAMSDGPIQKLFAADDPEGRSPDPAEGWLWLNTNRRWIPRQLAIGLSDAGIGDFDHLVRVASLYELLEATLAGEEDDLKLQAERKALRSALAEQLPMLRIPRLRVYARFREAEDASALLELLKLQVSEIPAEELPSGLRFDVRATALTAHFSVADMARADELDIREMLIAMGIVDLQDKPEIVTRAVDAVRALKAEVTVELVGTGLLLTVGPTSGGGPAGLPADTLRLPEQVGQPDVRTIAWGRWNATRLKAAAAAWLTMHEKWQASQAYALLASSPLATESMLDIFRDVAVRLRQVADSGALRVWHDADKSSVRLAMLEEPKAGAADLAGSALAKVLPASAEAFAVATDISLGQVVSDQLMQVEERLARQTLKAEIRGDGAAAEQMEIGYYQHFRLLRELIHRTGPDRFNPGYAAVFGTKGKVDRIEASFELQTRPQRLSGRDLPTPEFALIGTLRGSDAAGREYVEQTYSALLTGIRSAGRADALADRPLPALDIKAMKLELGLGVDTWGFDGTALTEATGEAKLRIDVQGDLKPHFFFIDRMVVFSTSPNLSKSILNARSGRAKRLMLPEEEEAALVAIGRVPGQTIGKLFEHLNAWYLAFVSSSGEDVEAPQHHRVRIATEALAAASRMMAKMEWTTTQPAGEKQQFTEGVVVFDE